MAYIRKTTPQFVEEAQRVHGRSSTIRKPSISTPTRQKKIKYRQCGIVFTQVAVAVIKTANWKDRLRSPTINYREVQITMHFPDCFVRKCIFMII